MCIILIGQINEHQFKEASQQNPDGFSCFTKELGLIKAPNPAQVREAMKQFAIWHFRIGTSGKKDESNIHPFNVCRSKYLLYHNGIICSPSGAKSDTHQLGDLLQEVSPMTADSVLDSLVKARHYDQKFVLCQNDDPRKFKIYGDWEFEDGVLMSHKLVTYVAPTQYYGGWQMDGGAYALKGHGGKSVFKKTKEE